MVETRRSFDLTRLARTVAAGLIGAAGFLAVDAIYPTLGASSRLDLPALLALVFTGQPDNIAAGVAIHFAVGLALALLYVYGEVYRFLPGRPWLRGVLYAFVIWVVHTVGMMPAVGLMANRMVEMGQVPSISYFVVRVGLIALVESLVAHLVYGALLGGISSATD